MTIKYLFYSFVAIQKLLKVHFNSVLAINQEKRE